MSQGGGGRGQLPPRFWRIRRRRRAAAARRITTCPPRFLDFATCLWSHCFSQNILRISALYCATLQGRNAYNFCFIFWKKQWNLLTFKSKAEVTANTKRPEAGVTANPKRGRGRPKKIRVEVAVNQVKRSRGRPRKLKAEQARPRYFCLPIDKF